MFDWDKEIDVEMRVVESNRTTVQKVKITPRQIVFEPYNHRPEDIMRSVCLVSKELILMYEAQAFSAQKSMDALKSAAEKQIEESPKKFKFKKG